MGALYGKYELLDGLRAYKVRPAPANPPGKFETGTGNFEGMAGVLGALEYFEWLGQTFGQEFAPQLSGPYSGRRLLLKQALTGIQAHELTLSQALMQALLGVPGLKLYGIADPNRLAERVPTFSFTLKNRQPRRAAEMLGQAGINVWDGNYYALAVTERLGLESQGGMVRVGAVHYNTLAEIQQLEAALRRLA
jgi:selenocysteine lyase/cysteine desulfurase